MLCLFHHNTFIDLYTVLRQYAVQIFQKAFFRRSAISAASYAHIFLQRIPFFSGNVAVRSINHDRVRILGIASTFNSEIDSTSIFSFSILSLKVSGSSVAMTSSVQLWKFLAGDMSIAEVMAPSPSKDLLK